MYNQCRFLSHFLIPQPMPLAWQAYSFSPTRSAWQAGEKVLGLKERHCMYNGNPR